VGQGLSVILAFAIAFVVGSIPLGVLVARASAGIDIRRYGTGNIGAYNVWRNVGLLPAAVVAVGSFLQGLLPARAAFAITGSEAALAAAAVGAVVGYAWSPWLRLRGGRAIGVGTGVATALYPPGLIVLLAFYGLGALGRRLAPGVLLGLIAYAAFVFYATASAPIRIAVLALLAVVIARRLEGARTDLGREDAPAVLWARLLHDRRPGHQLSGPIGG
jgi:glycerol-3-phosphate acyltransferase PlsY